MAVVVNPGLDRSGRNGINFNQLYENSCACCSNYCKAHEKRHFKRTGNEQDQLSFMIKKYFELEPLARGKRWILEGSSINNMEAVRSSFSQLISFLEEKELQSIRM
ncbi:hypothetical protein QTP86_015927 [Hemibagrus guttatus]|nr:hypothetical protein QTP86_015927 [Hemibagrus guttatus]